MGYTIRGTEVEADDEGFLLEPDYSREAALAIAASEGLELSDSHWQVIEALREMFRDQGQIPNFRNLVKDFDERFPGHDWKKELYDLFPTQPGRQACRIAGLPKPFGKGGY
jgi:tRNA 2-thiouridine synthesizing protein E